MYESNLSMTTYPLISSTPHSGYRLEWPLAYGLNFYRKLKWGFNYSTLLFTDTNSTALTKQFSAHNNDALTKNLELQSCNCQNWQTGQENSAKKPVVIKAIPGEDKCCNFDKPKDCILELWIYGRHWGCHYWQLHCLQLRNNWRSHSQVTPQSTTPCPLSQCPPLLQHLYQV
jgi:hypothetical protein